jgi:hypothetical protein
MSKWNMEAGQHQQVTEICTLKDILNHIQDSENGLILNLLDLPDPMGIAGSPDLLLWVPNPIYTVFLCVS